MNSHKKRKVFPLGKLTELILVELMSALPFNDAVRLLGSKSPKLKRLFSQAWVQNRVTGVTFKNLVEICNLFEQSKQTCCSDIMLRKLNGVVVITHEINVKRDLAICLTLMNKMDGVLHIKIQNYSGVAGVDILNLFRNVANREKISYVTWPCSNLHLLSRALRLLPGLVWMLRPDTGGGSVLFRPCLLNCRHIADVIIRVAGDVITGTNSHVTTRTDSDVTTRTDSDVTTRTDSDVSSSAEGGALTEVKRQASLRARQCGWLAGTDYWETEWRRGAA